MTVARVPARKRDIGEIGARLVLQPGDGMSQPDFGAVRRQRPPLDTLECSRQVIHRAPQPAGDLRGAKLALGMDRHQDPSTVGQLAMVRPSCAHGPQTRAGAMLVPGDSDQ